jgi:hypothetical protein
MESFKNGSEIINKEFKDTFRPSEEIRLRPYPGIAEIAFELYHHDYINLTSKNKFSSISTALIGAIIVQCIFIIRGLLENGFTDIKKNDIIIIISLIIFLLISILIDFSKNTEKRKIKKKIKKHFEQNKLPIEINRKP